MLPSLAKKRIHRCILYFYFQQARSVAYLRVGKQELFLVEINDSMDDILFSMYFPIYLFAME